MAPKAGGAPSGVAEKIDPAVLRPAAPSQQIISIEPGQLSTPMVRRDRVWRFGVMPGALQMASMRRQHDTATACPAHTGGRTSRADEFVPAKADAAQLCIARTAIRVWAHRDVLACYRSRDAAKLWIKLTDNEARRVAGAAGTQAMGRVRGVASHCGASIGAVWERVRRGEFEADRALRGCGQWGWWLSPPDDHIAAPEAPHCPRQEGSTHHGRLSSRDVQHQAL
jgi:hypothetical protein